MLAAKAHTGGAGAKGVVEGEQTGGQLLKGDAAVLAGVVLGEGQILLLPHQIDEHHTPRQGGGGFHRVRQPLAHILPDNQAVHHNFNGVFFVLLQLQLLVQLIEGAVHPDADVARLPGVLKGLGILALFAPHHRSHHLNTGPLRQGHHLIDDLVNGLLADFLAALGTVGRARPCPEKAQIVIHLRHGAHGGPGVF
ncbi:hypothetical protein SDC9_78098 [bioreactor metagenome]|uniref:Uncharacterized protein n=1 Tax=bioreactor metagenome TaxID=1076179 RepID=A0A644YYJ7_9ZZZZ